MEIKKLFNKTRKLDIIYFKVFIIKFQEKKK